MPKRDLLFGDYLNLVEEPPIRTQFEEFIRDLMEYADDPEKRLGDYQADRLTVERLQYFKDEQVLTFFGMTALFHVLWGKMDADARTGALVDLFGKTFGTRVAKADAGDPLKLSFGRKLTPCPGYLEAVRDWAENHPVLCVRRKAASGGDLSLLEKPVSINAVLENKRFFICFECKFLSDISYQVTFIPVLNQIVRVVDCGMYEARETGRMFAFTLVSPALFRDGDGARNRLYWYKMNEYSTYTEALYRDLGYEAPLIPDRLFWITWEDILWHIAMNRTLFERNEYPALSDFFRNRRIETPT
ncbi:MAG: hypothetical protein JSW52_01500 [Candidatus Coatesbacteria bacterium]|nr:MAG: hypothetical protein JSW52_01500 [Candidatus Coatesbacteria bacterium]